MIRPSYPWTSETLFADSTLAANHFHLIWVVFRSIAFRESRPLPTERGQRPPNALTPKRTQWLPSTWNLTPLYPLVDDYLWSVYDQVWLLEFVLEQNRAMCPSLRDVSMSSIMRSLSPLAKQYLGRDFPKELAIGGEGKWSKRDDALEAPFVGCAYGVPRFLGGLYGKPSG